jgi:hypothetical protein
MDIIHRIKLKWFGHVEYYNDKGRLHRLNGPAYETQCRRCWYKNGLPHRIGGPAIEYFDGWKQWCVDGKIHRLDGPALEYGDIKRWYIDDIEICCQTQEEFEQYLKLKAFW